MVRFLWEDFDLSPNLSPPLPNPLLRGEGKGVPMGLFINREGKGVPMGLLFNGEGSKKIAFSF